MLQEVLLINANELALFSVVFDDMYIQHQLNKTYNLKDVHFTISNATNIHKAILIK